MMKPFSHAKQFIEQLKSIEQKISRNELEDAARQLNLLGKTSSHDPRLFLLGSRLAEAAHNPEGMLQAARKAYQLAPQWTPAIMHLAVVLEKRNETDEALGLAGQAVQLAAQDVGSLVHAAALAQRLSRYEIALKWLRQAEQINPDDLNIQQQIARCLTAMGESVNAINLFSRLLEQLPNNPSLLFDRMRAYLQALQYDQAILDGEALVVMDPENAVYPFYLAIARGETPKTQPPEMVSALFDSYAAQFDQLHVVGLQYKLPRDVAQLIQQWHPDRKGDVLDLGCGTGLLGACLGPIDGVLVGVDLSGKMLEQAARHHVYDSFHVVNVLDALSATPENLYHVITALDVFNYVGSLETVVPNAYRILVPGGRFVFTCEVGAENDADYVLQRTYRYTHQRSYVQRLLEEAGFKDFSMEDRVLRYEAGEPVQGFLVTACKPAAGKTARRSPKSAKPGPLAK